MKNISAILQLGTHTHTHTPVYKQLCYGNFEKGHKRLRLADKWDPFMSLGRTMRKSVDEEDECLCSWCSHHGGSLLFSSRREEKAKNSVV